MAKRKRGRTDAEIRADKLRTGRPPMKKAEKHSRRIMVYLTPDEYKQFEAEAKKEGLSLASLIMRPWRNRED